jgi:hypothetical protein
VAAVVLATLLAGCPEGTPDHDALSGPNAASLDASSPTLHPTSGCADVAATLFRPTCAVAGCHSAASPASRLDLESPGLPGRLLGITSLEGAGLLVDPSAPEKSALYTKIGDPPPAGARMPLGGAPVSPEVRACVLAWLGTPPAPASREAGAPEMPSLPVDDDGGAPHADEAGAPPDDDAATPPDEDGATPPDDDADAPAADDAG